MKEAPAVIEGEITLVALVPLIQREDGHWARMLGKWVNQDGDIADEKLAAVLTHVCDKATEAGLDA